MLTREHFRILRQFGAHRAGPQLAAETLADHLHQLAETKAQAQSDRLKALFTAAGQCSPQERQTWATGVMMRMAEDDPQAARQFAQALDRRVDEAERERLERAADAARSA